MKNHEFFCIKFYYIEVYYQLFIFSFSEVEHLKSNGSDGDVNSLQKQVEALRNELDEKEKYFNERIKTLQDNNRKIENENLRLKKEQVEDVETEEIGIFCSYIKKMI